MYPLKYEKKCAGTDKKQSLKTRYIIAQMVERDGQFLAERYERRIAKEVQVGDICIGGENPVVVQSMTTEKTLDIHGVTSQIIGLHKRGAELVRVTTQTVREAEAVGDIKSELRAKYMDVPIIADVHHMGRDIAIVAAIEADKVRINTGLYVLNKGRKSKYSQADTEQHLSEIEAALVPLLDVCKAEGTPIRLGSNHGSLSDRIMVTHGDTPLGMVVSVMEYIRICEAHGFKNLVLSLKSSNVRAMQSANRLMVKTMEEEGMNYPIHLGVTESGFGEAGRIKSSVGIGTLLSEGIGDTIRVSLAEDPVQELDVCYEILQATGVRRTLLEIIACPTCGRTESDEVITLATKVKEALPRRLPMSIAIMGCVVNGPGEVRGADYGFWAVGNKWELRRGEEKIGKIPLEDLDGAVEALLNVVKDDARYIKIAAA